LRCAATLLSIQAKNAAAADADKVDIGALGKDFVAACSSMILKVRSKAGITRATFGGKKDV
jgi:hypothetical protein